MTGFIIFVGVVAALVWFIRYLRKRELEAFLETDVAALEEFKNQLGIEPAPLSITSAAHNANGPALEVVARETVLDEIHGSFLAALDKVLKGRFHIFVQVPLTDFVRIESGADQLAGKRVSFLVCTKPDYRMAFGILLCGSEPAEEARRRTIEAVFRQIDKPLVSFPMLQNVSAREIDEALSDVLGSPAERHCPKCGKPMSMRRAVKGANAGKTFWVCKEFPSCRGIMRIGGW